MGKREMTNEEFQLLKFGLEDARKSILERVKQRETLLLYYLGAVTTILGIAIKESPEYSLLLLIPYLALGATLIISFHNTMMNASSEFIVNEIFKKLKDNNIDIPVWDASKALNDISKRATSLRVSAFLYLILLPAVLSLVVNFSNLTTWTLKWIWGFGVICLLISFWTFRLTSKQRLQFHKKIREAL